MLTRGVSRWRSSEKTEVSEVDVELGGSPRLGGARAWPCDIVMKALAVVRRLMEEVIARLNGDVCGGDRGVTASGGDRGTEESMAKGCSAMP